MVRNTFLHRLADNIHIQRSVDALSQALSEWDEDEDGAIVVVSHDRNFCNEINFTHVATVKGGKMTMEQRSVRDSDWVIDSLSSEAREERINNDEAPPASPVHQLDEKQRKQAYNAPKRIANLENMIEELEGKIAEIETTMLAHGNDVGKLVDLTKEKEDFQAKVDDYMSEWEELEALLTQVAQ